MFCKYCGNELKENARFCTKCGRENISKVNVDNEFDKEIIPNISTDIVEKSMIEEDKTEMFDGVEETQNQMDSHTEEEMHTAETPVAKTSKNGNNKAVKVILIIIMLLVVASGGAFAGLKYLEYKEEKRLIEEQKSYEEYMKSVEKLLQKNKEEIGNYILNTEQNEEYSSLIKLLNHGIKLKDDKKSLSEKEEELKRFMEKLGDENKKELTDKIEEVKLEKNKLKENVESFADKTDYDEIEGNIVKISALVEQAKYSEADNMIAEMKTKISFFTDLPNNYTVSIRKVDLRSFPTIKMYVSVNGANSGSYLSPINGLSDSEFFVTTKRGQNGKYVRSSKPMVAVTNECREFGEEGVYELEYKVNEPKDIEKNCFANVYVIDKEGKGGYDKGYQFSMNDLCRQMYEDFQKAEYNCQHMGENHLIESGLILTTNKAYSDKKYLAYQEKDNIEKGGMGSDKTENSYEIEESNFIESEKDGDGFIIWGFAKYNVNQKKKYSSLKDDRAKKMAEEDYGYYYDEEDNEGYIQYKEDLSNQLFWINKIIGNYEKIRMEKDSDGRWKLSTREYARKDGGEAITLIDILSVRRAYD